MVVGEPDDGYLIIAARLYFAIATSVGLFFVYTVPPALWIVFERLLA